MQKDKVIIYTDGAARGNPGPAGWGAVILYRDQVYELGGRSFHATNNQMELTAPIEALKFVEKNKFTDSIEIFSDSKYVVLGITTWIFGWLRNDWRNANKKKVVNKELWEELHALNQKLHPKWDYVEGHNGDPNNERADLIATSFADNEPVI